MARNLSWPAHSMHMKALGLDTYTVQSMKWSACFTQVCMRLHNTSALRIARRPLQEDTKPPRQGVDSRRETRV